MAGWQDGAVISPTGPAQTGAPDTTQPDSPAASPVAPWSEVPISADQASQLWSNTAGPQPYAQSAEESAAWETSPGSRFAAPTTYIRVDPKTGGYFLRSQAPADNGNASPAPASADQGQAGPASSAPATGGEPGGTGKAAWQAGTPVDDSEASPDAPAPLTPSQAAAQNDVIGKDSNPAVMKNIVAPWELAGKDVTLGLSDVILPAAAAAITGVKNLVGKGDGASMADVYAANKKAEDDREQEWADQNGVTRGAAVGMGIGGAFLTPGLGATSKFIMAGLPKLAAKIPEAISIAKPIIAGGGTTARTIRAGAVGAGMGAIQGAATAVNPRDLPRMVASGAGLGAAGGAITQPASEALFAAATPVIRPILNRFKPPVMTDAVTAAKDALTKSGLDYDALSPTAQMQFVGQVKAGRDPGQLAMSLAAQDLPVSVRLSRGQMSGSPIDQLEENLALRGAKGQDAQTVARTFLNDQQRALRSNADEIATRIAKGSPPGVGGSGAKVSDALNARYDAKKAVVDRAYDQARAAPDAVLPAYDGEALAGRVSHAVSDFDPLNVPRVAREVDRLHSAAAGRTDADLKTLFQARTRLTNLRASNDPVEGKAARLAVEAFDKAMDEAVSNDLFKGDPKSVALWKDAIAERREFGKLFQGNDLIEKLTQREPRAGRVQLKVDAHDAANYIFGRSNLGFVGRKNLYRDLGRLKTVLGADSPEWNAIRSEAFQRIATTAEGPVEFGNQQFSGAKLLKAWRGAKGKDPELINTLFSPEERRTVDQFANIAAKVTTPVRGGDNPSNTSVGMKALRAVKKLPFMALEWIPFVDKVVERVEHGVNMHAIQARTVNAKPAMAKVNTLPAATYVGQAANVAHSAYSLPRMRDAN